MKDSTRRRFLRTGGVVGIAGLTGCSQITGGNDIKDTDGDGVIDSEDYAPRDASVQDAEDVEETGSAEENEESDQSEQDESTEQNDDQGGNTFSLEMYADGEQRFSETTTVEGVSTFLPDIVVGTDYDGEGGCATSTYSARITDMSISSGGSSNDIVDRVPLTEFARDDKRREVYSNPASGSDNWRLSFTIEPRGPEYTTPQSYNCASEMVIRLTENGEWFTNSDKDAPNNQIQYEISTEQDGWKRHGVGIPGGSGDLNPNGDNLQAKGLYQENVEWEVIIERS